ncbi:GNAT family N-acetyltransferase [Butyricicoccus sp.]|uniref:GNAT family N-acetyltransferase n=1 Tax=Butyricicoccus sp. TaxID=2049021 RepID=UPI003F154505
MISYEPLTADRIDACIAFWQQIEGVHLHTNGEDTQEGIQAYLLRNPDCSYIAVENGTIVGAVLAGHDGRRGFINHLAVHPSYRKQGIGTALMHLTEQAFCRNGMHKCALFVLKENTKAAEFYQNIGWSEETIVNVFSKIITWEEGEENDE